MAGNDPHSDEIPENQKGVISHLLKQLKPGMDLSRITFPTFVLEPRSLLEKITDFFSHLDFIIAATTTDDDLARFLLVLKTYLSGYHVRPKGVKKPYNPILGEVFLSRFEHSKSEGETVYVAEQVSHHPPISAFHASNLKDGFSVEGEFIPKSKFFGTSMSVGSVMDGSTRFTLHENPTTGRNAEVYTVSYPNAYARGIVFGTLLMELGEEVTMSCPQTGYHASVKFKTKGMFGGSYDKVEGKVWHKDSKRKILAKIEGTWSDVMEITMDGGSKEVFFSSETEVNDMIVDSSSAVEGEEAVVSPGRWESRNLWRKVTEAISTRDPDAATKWKTVLEEAQRAEKKERDEAEKTWTPKYFKEREDGSWEYLKGSDPKEIVVGAAAPLHPTGWEEIGAAERAIPTPESEDEDEVEEGTTEGEPAVKAPKE